MPVYQYRAVSTLGKMTKGLVEAPTLDAVAELISDRKLFVVSVQEHKKALIKISIPIFKKVRKKSIVIFSRQLAVMIAATVPVVQALRILIVQTNDHAFKDVLADMANDIDGGMKLSSAFAKHPDEFSDFYVAMIRSGETSGRLERVLNYLATQMEKDYDLISRIRGAMVYPIFIISSMIAVGATMLIFVVPKMTTLLEETGAELPLMTKILIYVSDFLVGYWWLLFIIVSILLTLFRLYLRSKQGRRQWDAFKLYIPIFGTLFKKIILSRFATGLSTLIKGGVPISRALQITSDVVSNQSFKAIIDDTVKEVEDGNSITTVFSQHRLVPTMVPQMMSVGERTGRMDEVLDRLGEFYSREVDTMIASLTSLIEPMIMIILGVAVGLMVSAIILPIFNIANSIS